MIPLVPSGTQDKEVLQRACWFGNNAIAFQKKPSEAFFQRQGSLDFGTQDQTVMQSFKKAQVICFSIFDICLTIRRLDFVKVKKLGMQACRQFKACRELLDASSRNDHVAD